MISEQFDYVVIDGEAGIEQINRRVMEKVTHLLLISDTSKKGLEVIKTIENVAMELVKYDRIGLIEMCIRDRARRAAMPPHRESYRARPRAGSRSPGRSRRAKAPRARP